MQSKFCILQISDASGVADASMFSETLTMYRDLIEVGNIVVMDITCHKNDEQVRIIVDKMRKFDASKAPRAVNEQLSTNFDKVAQKPITKILQLKIAGKNELIAVKNLIDNLKKGGNYFIELLLSEKILLPDRYFLTSYDILDFRTIIGVNNANEIVVE